MVARGTLVTKARWVIVQVLKNFYFNGTVRFVALEILMTFSIF